jgi:hypothetical protein
MWIVCAAAALISLVFVRAMRRSVKDREHLPSL